MRKVMVSKYVIGESGRHEPKEKGIASFHCFGIDYEEFDTGPGGYSVAIVEWPDGQVESVPVNLVKFMDSAR